MDWSLHDAAGARKYLVATERRAFLRAAFDVGGKTATFCLVLAISGARISEVLALTPEHIDDGNQAINIETLKRRRRGVIRVIPLPAKLLSHLDRVHHYRSAQRQERTASERLWSWSRTTAWRRVKLVMQKAKTPLFVSQPKALRHAFGAEAALKQIGLTLIKKWMGHSRLETTEIYTSLIGKEERRLASLLWKDIQRLL